MKRGTLAHPKTRRIARRLGLEPYAALGLLEALLHWAYEYAPRGDVGRHTNVDLAEGVGWPGDPEVLIAALVAEHWLDPCIVNRFVIHDLGDHADRIWQQRLQRKGVDFAVATPPPDPHDGGFTEDSQRSLTEDSTKPQRVLSEASLKPPSGPVLSCPVRSGPVRSRPDQREDLELSLASLARPPADDFATFWKLYPRHEGKAAARKAWLKLQATPTLCEAIARALAWQRQSARWLEENGRFIPHPATYLNGHRWEDEPQRQPAFTTSRTAGNLVAIKRGLGLEGT